MPITIQHIHRESHPTMISNKNLVVFQRLRKKRASPLFISCLKRLFCLVLLLQSIFLAVPAGAIESSEDRTAAAVPAQTGKIQSLMERGSSLDARSKYAKAIDVYSAIITLSPKNARAYYRRGLSRANDAQYQNAIEDFNKAIEIEEHYTDAYYMRGLCFAWTKDYQKALADFDFVLSQNPKSKGALGGKATVYEKMEKEEAASLPSGEWIADGVPGKPDFSQFMSSLQREARSHWHPPRREITQDLRVCFKAHRDGTITDLKLEVPTGDTALDEACLNAIRQVKRPGPFPPGAPEEVDILFAFDYRVIGKPQSQEHKLFNQATALEEKHKKEQAIEIYKEMLSQYKSGKDKFKNERIHKLRTRISSAYKELAVSNKGNFPVVIHYLEQSVYYENDPDDTLAESTGSIKESGKDPYSADVRVSLGDAALSQNDPIGALVEYQEALKIKRDAAVESKLESVKSLAERQ